MTGLSQKEGELAARTEQLLALVEETQFGIALPTALRVFSREMRDVEGWLKEADASARTVAMEKRIEDDLLGLLQAVRRLPPTTPPPTGSPLPSDLLERERELNRLVAELKTIRLLQSRLNDDTVGVDKTRPAPSTLPRRSAARSRPWRPPRKISASHSPRSRNGLNNPDARSFCWNPFHFLQSMREP